MAGYWPPFFFCEFMDRDEVEVHKHARKELGQYPAIWSFRESSFPLTSGRKLVNGNEDSGDDSDDSGNEIDIPVVNPHSHQVVTSGSHAK